MRTADLRARIAVFVQGDFFIGDVDAEILQQLNAAVRHLVAAREFVLLIFAECGQEFFGNVQREDFHFRTGIKYRELGAVDDFYFAVFGGGRMQFVQPGHGVMVGSAPALLARFFRRRCKSSDGERKPSEAMEWVCKSIMAVRFLKLKTV